MPRLLAAATASTLRLAAVSPSCSLITFNNCKLFSSTLPSSHHPAETRGAVHRRTGRLARPASYGPFPSRRRRSPLRWRVPWPARVRPRHRPRGRRTVGQLQAHSQPLLGAPAPARPPPCHALAQTPRTPSPWSNPKNLHYQGL